MLSGLTPAWAGEGERTRHEVEWPTREEKSAAGPSLEVVVEESRPRIPGSVHVLDETDLKRFDYADVHRVLQQVPGVYVRGEEGYGLRPNIGFRGASSERSSKVTLMEDGVLFAPAPYSAPAAYYFPLMARMTGVEVLKGPASIRYGPNTIGGALNLRSRPIPRESKGFVDLGLGTDRFGKLHGYWGSGGPRWGALLEGVRLQTAGFKELDGGGNTGFEKNEFVGKVEVRTDPAGTLQHQVGLRLGYADEISNETYLGLTDQDFDRSPYRRYAASRRDRMDLTRTSARFDYRVAWAESLDLQAALYRHDFSRAWRKLNRFRGGGDLKDLLENSEEGQPAVYAAVLKGDEDSAGEDQTLLVGTNDRKFVSEGVALVGHWRPTWGPVRQSIEPGIRFHTDRIRRNHTEDGYLMTGATLVPDGGESSTTANSLGSARAWAIHLSDQIEMGPLLLVPGVRTERIGTEFEDRLSGNRMVGSGAVWLPGMGAQAKILPWLVALAGVHEGFSPVSPGQPAEVRPERSTNYEGGTRLEWREGEAGVIGFFNDYSNLTGECTLSSGCPEELLNRQFNAGAVFVYGLEAALKHSIQAPGGVRLHGDVAYTYTQSDFRTRFTSENPQFGDVEPGDELPYVPNHQATLMAGASRRAWSVDLSLSYAGDMRDVAGQGPIPPNERVEGHVVIDGSVGYEVTERAQIYLTAQNLLNEEYMLSRRPFGARPGPPLQVLSGLRYRWGGGGHR